ncbi:MAG: FHA domain-containing protein [Myxococcaceae bacterium]
MPVALSQLARKLFVNPKPGSEPTTPGLVWEAPPSESTDSGSWALTDAGQDMKRPRAGEPLIFFVQKTTGANNPFAMGITVGRVDNNDVVVDDASVSRFHAWLQQDDRTKEWSLTDAESKNGTWVDGAKAEPRKRIVLKDGSKLKFGDCEMTFFMPPALKTFVESRFKR